VSKPGDICRKRQLLVGCIAAAPLLLIGCSSSAHGGGKQSTRADTAPVAPVKSSSAAVTAPAAGQIVFRRYLDAAETTGALFVSKPDGTGLRQLTKSSSGVLDDEPNWSSDGTRIVFTRTLAAGTEHESDRLFTMWSDGTHVTSISPARLSSGDPMDGFDGTAAFSPDGKQIAFSHAYGKVKNAIQHSDIWVMNADGSHRRPLTHTVDYAGDSKGIAWSPDGKHLVFGRLNSETADPPNGAALFVIDVDGGHERQLTKWSVGAGGTPGWSAANLIVFRAVADEESGIGNFFTINADGTRLRQITHFATTVISHKAGFSPDGKWVIFAREATAGNNDLFIAKTDGSELRALTNTPQAESSADWGASR
jgi:TolB protein